MTVYTINEKEVSKEEYDAAWAKILAKRAALGGGTVEPGDEVGTLCRPACWPHVSLANAVNPKQVAEANAGLAAAGLKAHHQADGRLVSPTAADRKAYLKHKGKVDFEAFS